MIFNKFYVSNTNTLHNFVDLIYNSGKFMLLEKMLPKLKEQESKVVLWCTNVSCQKEKYFA